MSILKPLNPEPGTDHVGDLLYSAMICQTDLKWSH